MKLFGLIYSFTLYTLKKLCKKYTYRFYSNFIGVEEKAYGTSSSTALWYLLHNVSFTL